MKNSINSIIDNLNDNSDEVVFELPVAAKTKAVKEVKVQLTAKTPRKTKAVKITTEQPEAATAEIDDFTAMMADADITPEVVEAAVAPVAPVAPVAVKTPKNNDGLTIREIAILKAIKSSTFADPETGSVPSFTLEMDTPVELGKNRTNTPIPGLVASLNKKGAIVTFKIKGQTMIELTVIGEEFLEMLK